MNFKEEINRLIHANKQIAFVHDFLNEHDGAELYLVGGTVRDLLIRRTQSPSISVDFDFVIRGMEQEALEQWFSLRGEINLVGKTFGVFRFMPEGMDTTHTHYIDIALPRTEQAHTNTKGGYREFDVQSDANLPIEDDLSRRDFTMNAMAINMQTGELVDPYNGQNDIKSRTIRAVGDPQKRFDEDISRILRAIRFASELNFEIEEKTLAAMKKNSEKLNETIVPRETIGSELAKSLAANPEGAVKWLNETGAMTTLLQKTGSGDPAYKKLPQQNPTLVVALLLQANERENILNILSRSGLDSLPHDTPLRIEPTTVLWLVDRLQEKWSEATVSALRASVFEKYFMNGRASLLVKALELTGHTTATSRAKNRARQIRDRWGVEDTEPIPPLVSGNDVIEAGVHAGPQVRELLEEVRDRQLEGELLTREQAKSWLKQKIPA